ncbi:CC0125/CC1285 family lipoprotein [Alteromonas ponticola]|uniref:CC0125/CC1285 family lipoprotein n=1 Tax=Alteromonas ponticola TaxID=2720613 RepID=UPI0031B5C7BD
MKRHHFLLAAVLTTTTLLGCAGNTKDYREATRGGFGYTETKLSDTQYRVHFKARGTDRAKAMDYAMLRAAEVTILNDFDWFVVTDRETLVDKERVETGPQFGFQQRYSRVTECGALGCRTTLYPSSQFNTGIFVGGSDRSEIESVLSIEVGRGEQPQRENTYDARQVRNNLMPKKVE